MALPTLSSPKHVLTVPSTKEKVKFRPFVVREEKILLMALESKDPSSMINTLCDVVETCTDGKITADKYPIFDLEYVFLHLRMKSVGEVVTLSLPCKNEACGEITKVALDLADIKVKMGKFEGKNHTFKVNDTVFVTFRYPTMVEGKKYDIQTLDANGIISIISDCLVNVIDGDETIGRNDVSEKEIQDFVESLPSSVFKSVVDYFQDVPKLSHTISFKCPKCGEISTYDLEGIQDFFKYASFTTT